MSKSAALTLFGLTAGVITVLLYRRLADQGELADASSLVDRIGRDLEELEKKVETLVKPIVKA